MVNENDENQIKLVRENFSGRVFKDTNTGDIVEIPDDIIPGDVITIGNCYIDVGDGDYYKAGGRGLKEITKK